MAKKKAEKVVEEVVEEVVEQVEATQEPQGLPSAFDEQEIADAESSKNEEQPLGDYDIDPNAGAYLEDEGETDDEVSEDAETVAETEDSEEVDDVHAETEDEAKAEADETADAEDEFDDELVGWAKDFGLDKADLEGMGSKQAAEKVILNLMNKRIENQSKPQAEGEAVKQPAPKAEPAVKQEREPTERDFKLDLDPEEYDEGLVDQLTKMNSHYSSQMEDVMSAVGEIISEMQRTTQSGQEARFDEFVNSVEGYEEELGQGKTSALDRDSKHFKNRSEIYKNAQLLAELHRQSSDGKGTPSERELYDRAVRVVFHDKQLKVARKTIAKKLNKRNMIARTAKSNGSPMSPEEEAIAYVNSFQEENSEIFGGLGNGEVRDSFL